MKRFVYLLAASAALCATAPAPLHAQAGYTVGAAGSVAATVRPGDMLRITVWPQNELGGEFLVEESGIVYLPLLGPVQVIGVAVESLRAQLREAYTGATKSPVVMITPVFRVGVLGEVRSPGLYSVTPAHSLFDVIGMAGGFSERANARKVRVVREGQVIELDALQSLDRAVDLHALTLRSGDQVVVERRSDFELGNARNLVFLLQSIVLSLNLIDRF